MTGGPESQHEGGRDQVSAEQLSDEGVGLGVSDDGSTFEPEETPESVDEPRTDPGDGPGSGQGGGGQEALDDVVEPRELVPDEDRADEVEMPHDVQPDDQRDVDDVVEQESERLLPDDERPVPGGPADD